MMVPDSPTPMPTLPVNHVRHHHRAARIRPALVAIVVGLGVLGGIMPEAVAAPSASASQSKAKASKHRCACGMDCGAVCCCKPKAADEPKSPLQKSGRSGPCIGATPCGGAMPSGVSVTSVALEKADRVEKAAFVAFRSLTLLAPAESDRPRVRLESPPDEPPERSFDA